MRRVVLLEPVPDRERIRWITHRPVTRYFDAVNNAPLKETRMSVDVIREEGGVRIRVDREGERAVSALLSDEDAAMVLEQLAGVTGHTVTPTGTTGDTVGVSDEATVETSEG
jgi:hypothetical protein